jgi:hypothetical protein
MSDSTYEALAPNGKLHTLHVAGGYRRGFVYVSGRRVYGTYDNPVYSTEHSRPVFPFKPDGKWAYLLAPNTAAVQPETVSV